MKLAFVILMMTVLVAFILFIIGIVYGVKMSKLHVEQEKDKVQKDKYKTIAIGCSISGVVLLIVSIGIWWWLKHSPQRQELSNIAQRIQGLEDPQALTNECDNFAMTLLNANESAGTLPYELGPSKIAECKRLAGKYA